MMEATTGPLITHQRAVFSFVSQHLEEKEKDGSYEVFYQTQKILHYKIPC